MIGFRVEWRAAPRSGTVETNSTLTPIYSDPDLMTPIDATGRDLREI